MKPREKIREELTAEIEGGEETPARASCRLLARPGLAAGLLPLALIEVMAGFLLAY